jgi:hypothetical protein
MTVSVEARPRCADAPPVRRRGRIGVFQDAGEFTTVALAAMGVLLARGYSPTQTRVAEVLSQLPRFAAFDDRRIRGWCHRYDIVWDDLVAEARASLASRRDRSG